MKPLIVIIPVYNEEATIVEIITRVMTHPLVDKVICVDDCSTDTTFQKISQILNTNQADKKIFLTRHNNNKGKGAAIKTAKELTSQIGIPDNSIILIQDADLEYSPDDYERVIKPILDGKADVVYGSRFLGHNGHRVLYYWHYLGNKLLTTLSNIFTNLNMTDMETGTKAFTKTVWENLELQECRFGIEPEITAKVASMKLNTIGKNNVQTQARVYEVPISYHGRSYAEGKKISWRDGVSALRCIVVYNTIKRNFKR